MGISWGCQPSGLVFSSPIHHSRAHLGSAADGRFSLSTAAHAPQGLHRCYSSALREESAKVRRWRGEGGRVSPGEFGVSSAVCLAPVSQTGWCVVQILPLPPPRPVSTTAAALGLGPSLAATAVPRLASASWWAGGRGWRVTSP